MPIQLGNRPKGQPSGNRGGENTRVVLCQRGKLNRNGAGEECRQPDVALNSDDGRRRCQCGDHDTCPARAGHLAIEKPRHLSPSQSRWVVQTRRPLRHSAEDLPLRVVLRRSRPVEWATSRGSPRQTSSPGETTARWGRGSGPLHSLHGSANGFPSVSPSLSGIVLVHGPLAQLVAHLHDTQGVVGSSPARPTKKSLVRSFWPGILSRPDAVQCQITATMTATAMNLAERR